jgi:hypothetical protein
MQNQLPDRVTSPFVTQHQADVIGVLHGFDRLRLRGTLRHLYQPRALLRYLYFCQVMVQGFKKYALDLTGRIVAHAQQMAQDAQRPWVYLPSTFTSKEQLARRLARELDVRKGLIAVLRCVEPCQTFEVRGREVVFKSAKCLHLYFYEQHPLFGFMHLRLQTWFPFQIEICLNGREWLCRQLARARVDYQRQDNYVAWVEDLARAQALLDRQAQTSWSAPLQKLLDRYHPLHREVCRPLDWEYYWTCCESEFASDVLFREPSRLAALYPRLVQHALLQFQSKDVLRFLGRNVPLSGKSRFAGQVLSDLKARPEGLRIKHRVGRNSLKMYDKFGRGLRVETTINECEDFYVFRRAEGDPEGEKKWRALRRGLADLPRRAAVSRAANQRYLVALAAVKDTTPLGELTAALCRPVCRGGRRYRALNPFSPADSTLLEALQRGEWTVSGLRNRDLRRALYPRQGSADEERRRAARVSRLLALLRAHGILRKAGRSHRYYVSAGGRVQITALLAARRATPEQLTRPVPLTPATSAQE